MMYFHFLRQNLGRSHGKPESEPHGEIAQTLEKLVKNDPTEPHTATRDKNTADSILSSNTFCVFWGGGSCICFHFLSCPLLFSLVCLPLVTDDVFFFHFSFFLLLFASLKEKEEKKRNGINMRKEEKNKKRTQTKKENHKKMKDKKKETQQRMINKGGMNKSILCQQRGYFLFCCPTTVLKNRV